MSIIANGKTYNLFYNNNTYSIFKNRVRTYYKYVYTTWNNPTLTSNTSDNNFKVIDAGRGTYKSSSSNNYSPAISGRTGMFNVSNAYKAFDGNDNTMSLGGYRADAHTNITTIIITGTPVKLTNCKYLTNGKGSEHNGTDYFLIYGSNDGSDWYPVGYKKSTSSEFGPSQSSPGSYITVGLLSTNNYFKFFSFSLNYGPTDNDNVKLYEIKLTATQKTTVESDETDYDIYADSYVIY